MVPQLWVSRVMARLVLLESCNMPHFFSQLAATVTRLGNLALSTNDESPHAQAGEMACVDSLEPRTLPSGLPVLVKDIHPLGGSGPEQMANVGGTLYFSADNGTNGRELWKSNGTAAGTVLVKDINPTAGTGSLPQQLTNVNGTLFFVANDGVSGPELWKSNGTAAGTVLVKDIVAGLGGSTPQKLVNVNGTLFFLADNGVNGRELWKSDGTAAGTVLVKDIFAGATTSSITEMVNLNGSLLFTASDGVHGNEMWRSNGTTAGTVLLSNVRSGAFGSYPRTLTVVGNHVFFSADTTVALSGRELWKTDGTSAGTVLVRDINSAGNSDPTLMVNVNGTLFFIAMNDDFTGFGLWKSNGTEQGTVLVKVPLFSPNVASMTSVNGVLYFTAKHRDDTLRRTLWKSDGTAAGTVEVLPSPFAFDPQELTSANGKLYFVSNTSGAASSRKLWSSDGTVEGTLPTPDVDLGSGIVGPTNLTTVGNRLFFAGSGELYVVSPSVLIMDDGDAGFTTTGPWVTRSGPGIGRTNDVRYAWAGTGASVATWNFSGLANGFYRVSATWPGWANRANNAPYQIRESASGPILRSTAVNQRLQPTGVADQGSTWQELGVVSIRDGNLVVQLSNNTSTGIVIADAVRIEYLPSYIIDDGQPGFSTTGSWTTRTEPGIGYLNDLRYASVGAVNTVARWTFDGLAAGSYRISATWPPSGNRTTQANYRIRQSMGGPVIASVDVSQNGLPLPSGTINWRELSSVAISAGQLIVELEHRGASGIAIADAVRIEAIPALINDSPAEISGSWGIQRNGRGGRELFATSAGVLSWNFNTLTPGTYQIAATWVSIFGASTAAPFRVRQGSSTTNLLSTTVDQNQNPAEFFADGSWWKSLGTVTITGNSVVVQLVSDNSGAVFVGDAIRVVRV